MPQKKLLTQQIVDMERRSRPNQRKPKKPRTQPEPGIHPEGCLCGENHEAGGDA